jgi:starch synthase (maltosyl-transferring)
MVGHATPAPAPGEEGRRRVVIEGVDPEIDCGIFPAKTVVGDRFVVEADAFADGHDRIRCVLLYRTERQRRWREVEMEALGNDRWRGGFVPDELGRMSYTLEAWVDRFGTWRHDLAKRMEAGQDVSVELEIGAGILDDVARRAVRNADARRIREAATELRALAATADVKGEVAVEVAAGGPPRIHVTSLEGATPSPDETSASPGANPWPGVPAAASAGADLWRGAQAKVSAGADPWPGAQAKASAGADPWPGAPPRAPSPDPTTSLTELLRELDGSVGDLVRANDPRQLATRYPKELEVLVDRERAAFSAWYEFFPRSTGKGGKHGTFADAERMLPYVKELGFDVVYLPPIHPIGHTKRKGPNNRPEASPGDHGSPWAIGSEEGGHDAVHPDLGTLADFRRFRERAESMGLEVALDVAFQVSPDHPWVREHPDWFRHRPDGSIHYAENPPKKYEDIFPFDFECEDWRGLWNGLKGVFEHWIREGVRIFRVDNPHTKSLAFWAWCIPHLKRRWPELIFLSEAFTRPRLMHHLAKLGFTQSYTYFTWRHHRWDITDYLTELTRSPARHYFRPSFWPNTPDILTETLQTGGRPAFLMRLVLAATMSSNYGIYGPAFELLEHAPRESGSEEYLSSEKYQLRTWDLERADSLRHVIARLNRARRQAPALQRNDNLVFHPTSNDELVAYSKRSARGDVVLCVVNLDPHHTQSGWTDLRMDALGVEGGADFQVHDVLSDARYHWHGPRNYVELNPWVFPAHVFRVARRVRSERDFDYYD